MKRKSLTTVVAAFVLMAMALSVSAQKIQYSRYYDKRGINVFEPSKKDSVKYDGFKLRIGGSFTQDYQSIKSTNKANYVATSSSNTVNRNLLVGLVKNTNGTFQNNDSVNSRMSGFNLAMANLNFDIQIDDGIRVFLENYMSTRHHNEFWVKGGYIQIDKLPMFNNPEWFTKYVRVKIGHFQPNFGDFQFRRSDGGNTIFNPFAENLLLDAFTTEIGGEIYVFPTSDVMIMGGMTSGFINGNIQPTAESINSNGVVRTKRSPSIFGKLAFDKQVQTDLRVRLSASVYNNANSVRNTLFAGDRTGSHYFAVMDPAQINGTATTITANFTSGRLDPGVANRVTAINFSPFVKYKGLELQGGYDNVKGSVFADVANNEWTKRKWNQVYGEVVYRFLKDESLYIGSRYVSATGEPSGLKYGTADAGKTNGAQAKINVNRLAFAAGYFPTKNMLLKLEYVKQNYKDYPWADYRYDAKFSGLMIEAVIGF
ncbi:MAG: hypothetical protein KGZ74_12970 [Chitinophagaceae bacterium]|nr:hypothetical protein [Chitinophagaceae bacterium]